MATLAMVAEKVGLQLLLEPQSSAPIFRGASTAVGLMYPVYCTYKAVEAPQAPRSEHTKWLTYWAAYGTITALEKALAPYISWFPWYQHIKFGVLLWLQLPPSMQGARQVYERLLKGFLPRYERKIDVCLDRTTAVLASVYAVYKVPLDAGAAAVAAAWVQVMHFFKWLSAPEDKDSNGKASVDSKPKPQLMVG